MLGPATAATGPARPKPALTPTAAAIVVTFATHDLATLLRPMQW